MLMLLQSADNKILTPPHTHADQARDVSALLFRVLEVVRVGGECWVVMGCLLFSMINFGKYIFYFDENEILGKYFFAPEILFDRRQIHSSFLCLYCGDVNPIGRRGLFNSLFLTCNFANDSLISSSCIRVSSLMSL